MRLFPLLLLSLFALACTEKSDEQLVREAVKRALDAVDDKRAGDVVADAAEDFAGPRGMDLRETRRYITGFLLGKKWVKAFDRALDVTVSGQTAHVDLEVVLAEGNEVKRLEDVVPTNATVLDIDLELEKRGGEWKFTEGAYKRARP